MDSPQPYLLCAVRGGPESKATVTKAIDLALEMKARLVFFHVSDVEFLGGAVVGSRLSVVHKELREMSEFAGLILCDRARRRGIEEVEYVVWEGNIRSQLKQAAIETHARILVMGRPTRSPGSNVFKEKEMAEFVRELEKVGDVEIIWVKPEA